MFCFRKVKRNVVHSFRCKKKCGALVSVQKEMWCTRFSVKRIVVHSFRCKKKCGDFVFMKFLQEFSVFGKRGSFWGGRNLAKSGTQKIENGHIRKGDGIFEKLVSKYGF